MEMKGGKVAYRWVGVFTSVAVGFAGLAAVAVCAMPPECPMNLAAPLEECCTPIPSAKGWRQDPPCHPEQVVALSSSTAQELPCIPLQQRAQRGQEASSLDLALPAGARMLQDAPELSTSIPRFLLTHTFRL